MSRIEVDKIMSGLLMIQIMGMWHDHLPGMSFPTETRLLVRACGDCFIENLYTINDTDTAAFGYEPYYGHGLYDTIRNHAEQLGRYMPFNGFNKTKDFPRGNFSFSMFNN